jgi:hypothetical protein
MGRIEVEAILFGTRPVPKYGMATFPVELLHSLRAQLMTDSIPLRIEHDARDEFEPRLLEAEVRPTSDGHWELWTRFEVDELEWERVGVRSGMSISFFASLTPFDSTSGKPQLLLAGEASSFQPHELLAAARILSRSANVSTALLFQFSDEAQQAVIVVSLSLELLKGIGTNALYDALKYLLELRRSKVGETSATTEFEFKSRTEVGLNGKITERTALLRTNDPDMLNSALETLRSVFDTDAELSEFNTGSGNWEEIRIRRHDGPTRNH